MRSLTVLGRLVALQIRRLLGPVGAPGLVAGIPAHFHAVLRCFVGCHVVGVADLVVAAVNAARPNYTPPLVSHDALDPIASRPAQLGVGVFVK